MFGNDISKVAGSVTHEPYKIEVQGVVLEVPRPVIRTQVRVAGLLSELGAVPDEPSYSEVIAYAGRAGVLSRVASLYLTGGENKSVIQRIEEAWSLDDLIGFVGEVMTKGGDFERFFAFTTSLQDRNLLKPTREVETASGLSSEASHTTTT